MFEDERFSFDRLKSFFLRSFCAWATMIPDVDLSFVRCLLCLLLLIWRVGRFLSWPSFCAGSRSPSYTFCILLRDARLTSSLF